MPVPGRSRPIAAAIVALAAIALAGCGGSSTEGNGLESNNGLESKTPAQILAAARDASRAAATVHIVGSVISEGKPISLNMELVAGKGAKGRLTLEGNALDIIDVEHAFYIKGSRAFYDRVAGPAAAALLEGKWLKADTTSHEFASIAQLTDLNTLLSQALASHGPLRVSGSAMVAGQQAVAVSDSDHGGTLYVAATGTPYPLQLSKGGSGGGTITFNRWNQPVALAAPAGAININQLQSGH